MTPRQADVAFVLDSLEGVRAAYAIDPARRAAEHFDFAVELEPGGRILAAVHYALLRVMPHDDCARVFLFHTEAPRVVADSACRLTLSESERQEARARVPPPPPRPEVVADPFPASVLPAVLIVDDDDAIAAVMGQVLEAPSQWAIVPDVDAAAKMARTRPFDLVLCAARRAFGMEGLLASLPIEVARRVLVLATPADLAAARWRLQGTGRILMKPFEAWRVRERIVRAGAMHLLALPDARLTRVVHASARRSR